MLLKPKLKDTVAIPKSPILCVIPFLVACGDEGSPAAAPAVRDSAGVRIVESLAAAWSPAEAWRVATSPQFDIGGAEGDPTQQLFGVVDAARLSDGRIVVANGGSQELLFYDTAGDHLLTAGGRGGGPGEFQSMRWVELAGDSLLVADRQPSTLAVFNLRGGFVRSERYEAAAPVGRFADGSVLATQTDFFEDLQDGLFRPPSTLLRLGSDGEAADTLGSAPGNEGFLRVGDQMVSVFRLPFARQTWTIVRGETFYVADSDRYEIGVYGIDGSLQASIRRSFENLVATEADLDVYIESRISAAGDNEARREAARGLRVFPMPETFPAFGWNVTGRAAPVLIDDLGNLWVLEYNRPGDEEYRWSVYDPAGGLLGEVTFPVVLEPMHIGDDFVLGKWRDDLDVEHVLLYELIKP